MKMSPKFYGYYLERPVFKYELENANGLRACLTDFGARLTEMHVPGRSGEMADIVLGFDRAEPYAASGKYFGAICGRYGNRINNGHYLLDSKWVSASRNEGTNHLHGGLEGFDLKIWNAKVDPGGNSIIFELHSPDGDEGFLGTLFVQAKYTLTDNNCLLVEMSATSDKTTIVNIIQHAYWNVAGHQSGHILDQYLTIAADFYTPVDDSLLATGEILSVAGTTFDFRKPKKIGKDIAVLANGYDHNFVLRGFAPEMNEVATLWHEASGRGFALRSTEPGLQIYTGGHLKGSAIGKGNTPYTAYAGLTFETQKFPCSPNFSHFPSVRLGPGEPYEHVMEFQFFAR